MFVCCVIRKKYETKNTGKRGVWVSKTNMRIINVNVTLRKAAKKTEMTPLVRLQS